MNKKKLFSAIVSLSLTACAVTASEITPPEEYLKWLDELKQEMTARGISQKTVNEAFAKNYYHPRHQAVKHDRNQTEFVLSTSGYLARVVSPLRVQRGRQEYERLSRQYPKGVSNVPLNYLMAFWGIETNYGTHKGGFKAIEALTVLSYDKRRSKFFREELYNALKIIDGGHISVDKMESSWAGAMGHFQFMPSTFAAYAVDGNGDGKINIWENFDDALASAGNYLSAMGWKMNDPWGVPVTLNWNFDYAETGRHNIKTIGEWEKLGVKTENLNKNLKGAVIVPEGHRGQAYMVFDNFHIIMQWNKSENYALAVGLLADKIKNKNTSEKMTGTETYHLTKDDVKKIQTFINEQKIASLSVDGNLGTQTRKAVQKLQKKFKLPADGYPDYRLLRNINNFSTNGYYPPVPSQKLHRRK